VGIAEPVYKPGVKLGDIEAGTIAARAGLRRGDIVLEVGDQLVAPRPGAVMQVVNAIK
jgi:S1-C subfamily serine protease